MVHSDTRSFILFTTSYLVGKNPEDVLALLTGTGARGLPDSQESSAPRKLHVPSL